MAYASREIPATADDVFAVLVDPETYPQWLIGASRIREVDDDWPRVGSRFHHRVGLGPLTIPDSTEVLAIEEGRRLELAVRARPLVSAVARFHIIDDGRTSVVSLEEEPKVRLIGNLVRPVLDPVTHVRNHLSLKRLADVVASRRSVRS